MKIIALTTSHNRCNLTLKSLTTLKEQRLSDDIELDICVVDDASSDNTGDEIKNQFPDVTILKGSGDLYWAGGMRFGWSHYVNNKEFDYLLVFNDDIKLFPDAISRLIEVAEEALKAGRILFAITGGFLIPGTDKTAYGGVERSSFWHPLRFKKISPTNDMQECDTLNMNLALISKQALKEIGFLSKEFIHAKADYDFGLRLKKAGGKVILAPGYMGVCNINSLDGTSSEKGLPFRQRWKRLISNKEQPPRQRAVYYKRHAGVLWPLFWMLPYIRVFFKR